MPDRKPSVQDPRISRIRDSLLAGEGQLPPLPGPAKDRAHAAVSVVFRAREELELLLIRRAEVEGDPWSGHMAFPGGRWSPSDLNLRDTAVRETMEETGLCLDTQGVDLGRLPPLQPNTFRLPPLSIFPFVFGVPPNASARVASREVDEIHWTPVAPLLAGESAATTAIDLGEITRDFPCFQVEGQAVWGLTYRILIGFFALITPPPTRR
jgi:8-oxo-dGTP pyrophosphatase MutT (NUDIX family)